MYGFYWGNLSILTTVSYKIISVCSREVYRLINIHFKRLLKMLNHHAYKIAYSEKLYVQLTQSHESTELLADFFLNGVINRFFPKMNAKCKQTTMYKQHVNDVCSQVCHI